MFCEGIMMDNLNILNNYLDVVNKRCRDLVKHLNDSGAAGVYDVYTLHDYAVSPAYYEAGAVNTAQKNKLFDVLT